MARIDQILAKLLHVKLYSCYRSIPLELTMLILNIFGLPEQSQHRCPKNH